MQGQSTAVGPAALFTRESLCMHKDPSWLAAWRGLHKAQYTWMFEVDSPGCDDYSTMRRGKACGHPSLSGLGYLIIFANDVHMLVA